MKYCKKCLLPDTRPNLIIEEDGVCNACKNFLKKETVIDWEYRKKAFEAVVKNAKKRSKGYDCLIPVSGGKDSTWQVIKCLEYGLNPLAVTWKTPARTDIGQQNLDNLIKLGVDHIDYQINPNTEKKFMYKALKKFGSTAIPMHMAIFSMPPRIALNFDIPLIVWGENSAMEYGTKKEELTGFKLDSKWRKLYGVTHGTEAKDWIADDLTEKELTPYFAPKDSELEQKDIKAVFLGYYFKWDVETSLHYALKHGFKVRAQGPKIGLYNYADIDDDFISIHHYIKWYKFGFTRLFDNLALEIRNKRLTRKKSLEILKKLGEQCPHEDIEKLCSFLNISCNHFYELIEPFRNLDIWEKKDGVWKIKDFIIPDWKWC
ncbi:MAG: Flagellin modification protein, PseA [uncultured bacterium]|nr:MAG: Flagellin modification protein, PseA [uncultured bacterium]